MTPENSVKVKMIYFYVSIAVNTTAIKKVCNQDF